MPTIAENKLIEYHLIHIGAIALELLDEIDGEMIPEILDQKELTSAGNLLRHLFAQQALYHRQCRFIERS